MKEGMSQKSNLIFVKTEQLEWDTSRCPRFAWLNQLVTAIPKSGDKKKAEKKTKKT